MYQMWSGSGKTRQVKVWEASAHNLWIVYARGSIPSSANRKETEYDFWRFIMKSAVIGQTGRAVLSDNLIQYKKSRKRTVRYQHEKVQQYWSAWVCGPFHSPTYGAHGFGITRARAKQSLYRNLANNHGYLGGMILSDVDESDTVGIVDPRLLD